MADPWPSSHTPQAAQRRITTISESNAEFQSYRTDRAVLWGVDCHAVRSETTASMVAGAFPSRRLFTKTKARWRTSKARSARERRAGASRAASGGRSLVSKKVQLIRLS